MGRHSWTSRGTVEDTPIHLSTSAFLRAGSLDRDVQHRMLKVSWRMPDGKSLGELEIEAVGESSWRGKWAIHIPRQVFPFGSRQVMGGGQTICITTTRPHFGGERLWFVCECDRRCGKLYLPTGETVFRCRLCCNLTYLASQERNTRTAVMRPLLERCWRAREWAERQARGTRRNSSSRLPDRRAN